MSDLSPYENRRVVDVEEVVRQLGELGLSVDVIAKSTRQDVGTVRSILVSGTVTDQIEEKRLEDDWRRLQSMAIREAFKIMQFGHTEQKMKVVQAMISNTGRAVGKEAKSPNDDIRTAFHQLIGEMTELDAPQTQAIAPPATDRNEEARRTTTRPRLYRPD